MSEFYPLELIEGYCTLVKSPSLILEGEVREYHLLLLEKVKTFAGYQEPVNDLLFYDAFCYYYHQIWRLLKVETPLAQITPESRHRFFIAKEQVGSFYFSGLEELMGYGFSENTSEKITITSGDIKLDIVAELLLNDCKNLPYLLSNFSSSELIKLCKQQSERTRGQEAIEDKQRELDLSQAQNFDENELRNAGFMMPL